MQSNVRTESETQRPAGIGRWALAGAAIGLLAGLAVCLLDVPAVFAGARERITMSRVAPLVRDSLTVLPPAFMLVGLVCSCVLWALRRLSRRLGVWAVGMLPLGAAAALFAYVVTWRLEAAAKLGLGFVAVALIGVPLAAWCCAAALRPLGRSILGARRPLLWVILPVAGLALSGAAIAWRQVAAARAALPPGLTAAKLDRPNVLLIVLDTFRVDHMSCYGYSRKTTPNVDAFAADARVYTRAISPAGWTLPSHASLFTGLPASAHGCDWGHPLLHPTLDTLAELLSAAGYQTAGLSSNIVVSPSVLFNQGFGMFWVPEEEDSRPPEDSALAYTATRRLLRGAPPSRAASMHKRLARWFREDYDPDRPFFIFLNYIEAHHPYAPPSGSLQWATEEMRARWAAADQRDLVVRYKYEPYLLSPQDIEELKTLYDEEIAYVDRMVGDLLNWLRHAGLLDDTLVVVTADHGEHFGEHGLMEHQFTVYEPDVHVPLIVRLPGVFEPGTDDHLVQTHDFFPTALEVAGVDWQPSPAQNCISLLDPASNAPRLIVSEYTSPWEGGLKAGLGLESPRAELFKQPVRALREGDTKILLWDKGYRELYQLDRDPRELDDLAGADKEEADTLAGQLREWLASLPPPGPPRPQRDLAGSPDDLRKLKALGYVQ